MEKYVECQNCQEQYDCERTYLGGCTDGKEWEEKKLTDDETVKALECMAGIIQRDCDNCPFMINKFCSDTELSTATLDLIHRLQDERDKQRKLYVKEFAEHANHLGEFERIKHQAVKDTAKEILLLSKDTPTYWDFVQAVKERYGV